MTWLLVLVVFATACDPKDANQPLDNSTDISLTVVPPTTGQVSTAAGLLVPVAAYAMSDGEPVSGLSVSFASNVTGVSFTPATVTTDNLGLATSAVVVPYGDTIIALVTSSGNGLGSQSVSADPLVLGFEQAPNTTPTPIPGGELLDLVGSAKYDGAPAQGVSLTFTTNTTGVTVAPSPALTNANGSAEVQVSVPYQATPVTAQVTGGNGVYMISLSALLPELTVSVSTEPGVGPGSGSGSNFQVIATVTDANTNMVPGITVAFAESGVGASSNPFTPASATTIGDGTAISHVTISASTFSAVLSVAGIAGECVLPTQGTPCTFEVGF